jgi:4-hydroxybenzoate polyprenyltransferase
MKLFLAYVRLIRPFNLLMIVFTIYMVRILLAPRGFDEEHFPLTVGRLTFGLFALSFVLVAAAGYIINDYYDVEIDKVNRPDRLIIGNTVSARHALITYWLLNILGIIAGFISCFRAGIPLLGTLFLFYAIGLWVYSYKLKSTFLFGNLLIGVFLALVPLGAAAIEIWAKTHGSLPDYSDYQIKLIWGVTGVLAIFAFLSTIIREIVKDMEDIEGDKLNGCRTIPVVIGIRKTKWIVFILTLMLNAGLACLLFGWNQFLIWPFIYFLILIQGPILLIYYWLIKPSSAKEFHKISIYLKILMLTGIVFVFYYVTVSYFVLQFFTL